LDDSLRNRARLILLLTPWVSIPLALLGVALALTYPLMLVTRLGWICDPVGVVLAAGLAVRLRSRYKLSILDSSPLGVFYWLQRRV
jgi:hypothetical protein